MTSVTYEDYKSKLREDPYFLGRWEYFSVVIEEAKKFSPDSVLEVGAAGFPMFTNCTTLDVDKKYKPTVLRNAVDTPWPFKDKEFDLFISLQTWEHLDGKQLETFREVRRVARRAILSFPYKWHSTDPTDFHNGLDESVFSRWTENVLARTVVSGIRIVYIFDSL